MKVTGDFVNVSLDQRIWVLLNPEGAPVLLDDYLGVWLERVRAEQDAKTLNIEVALHPDTFDHALRYAYRFGSGVWLLYDDDGMIVAADKDAVHEFVEQNDVLNYQAPALQ